MIVTKEKASVTGDLTFAKKVEMGFDPAARNMQVRNAIRMYANPRLAALREYTSNARDAHKAAGHTGPVEVTLPTAMHPFLTIVDHGVGLDSTELEGFGQFGHTTKDGSNDYIGGFGLGSKSGLAVADQFTVISVKDGKKNVVVVGWDESGAPSLGFLDEQSTSEPNGTTIQIPSATGHEDWRGIIEGNTFLGWTPGSIVVNGKEPGKSVHDTTQFKKLPGGWLTIQERENGRYYWPETVHALVHGVYYAIPHHKFESRDTARILDGSVLEIANGSVDILPSRDDLEWTDVTTREVRRVAKVMTEAIVADYQEQITKVKTFLEAKQIADAMDSIGLPVKGLTHKGILLDWTREDSVPLTYGKVKDSSTAKSGFQNERVATQTRSASEVHKTHSILVYGATGQTVISHYKKNMEFIAESSDTVAFVLAEAKRLGVDATKIRVYYTEKDKAGLPQGFVLAMRRVITAKTFSDQAAEQRKVWAKERAANRAAGAAPRPVDRQLRVVSSYNTWAYSFSLGERSEQAIIAAGRPVVVLHAGDPLASKVMVAHTSSSATGATGSLMALIAERAYATDTTFVVLAANHKAANLAITGWTNLTDWLRNELKSVPIQTPLQVNVANYRRSRPHYNAVPKIGAANIANIKNKALREWMEAYMAPAPTMTRHHEVAAAFPEYAPTQPAPLDYAPWDHYPLIIHLGIDKAEGHLFTDYVNLVDSARKGR